MDIRCLAPAAPSQYSPNIYFSCEFFSLPQAWFHMAGEQGEAPCAGRGAEPEPLTQEASRPAGPPAVRPFSSASHSSPTVHLGPMRTEHDQDVFIRGRKVQQSKNCRCFLRKIHARI